MLVTGVFLTAASEDDVIQSADAAEPLAQRLADAGVGHVTRELAEARVERRLERQEGRVRQEEDLVEEGQDHVGPRLQTEREGAESGIGPASGFCFNEFLCSLKEADGT